MNNFLLLAAIVIATVIVGTALTLAFFAVVMAGQSREYKQGGDDDR